MKTNTFRLISLIILTIIIFIGIIPLVNTSNAVTNLNPGQITTDLSRVDRTKYPGVVERVHALKQKYPNWNFEFYKTGLDWDRFIALEYAPQRNTSPFNLVHDSYAGTWICEYRGTKRYDSTNWFAASYQAVEYTADPRTYLNEDDIFSLKRVSDKKNALSKTDSLVVIKEALKGRSYLKHAETIYNVATSENADFVDVVARLIQEQGPGTVLTDGNRSADPKDTKLYYNPYNIGATGNSSQIVIANATKWAKQQGWDTFTKGLRGGIQKVKTDYKDQNTSYFEKFNSTKADYSGITHQYMQNITAPFSEGSNKKRLYQEVDNNLTKMSYTFVVPLYENMQKAATDAPNYCLPTPKAKTYTPPADPSLPAFANLTTGLNLRKGPGTEYGSYGIKSGGTLINVLEKKSNKWYYVEIVSTGEKGYMAKRVAGDPDYFDFQFKQNPTMYQKTKEYRQNINQASANLPSRAELTGSLNVRKAPNLSGAVLDTLPFKSVIYVREKMQNSGGYEWYRVSYSLNKAGTSFTKNGYMARGKVNSTDYYFNYTSLVDLTVLEELEPLNPTKESELINQKNPELPEYAILRFGMNVRKGSGSLSSEIIRKLPAGTRISVRSKAASKDGYDWYFIYYNLVDGKFKNSGYMARNRVGETVYNFRYIVNPDWTKCAFLLSQEDTNNNTNNNQTPVSEYPKTAKTTTSLNVRRGSGSVSSARVTTLAKNTTISVRKKMPDKDGYAWYFIYYNLVNGKYKNSGYVARNALKSTDYYFTYTTTSGSTGSTTTSTYPRTAKTTTSLNVRRGSGSLSSPIINTISTNTTISVRKQMPSKDGYTWYQIYYNLKNGKYQNSGYIARNKVGSSSYYFKYN